MPGEKCSRNIHNWQSTSKPSRARFLSAKHKLNYELRIVQLIVRVQNGGPAVRFLPNRRVLIERGQTNKCRFNRSEEIAERYSWKRLVPNQFRNDPNGRVIELTFGRIVCYAKDLLADPYDPQVYKSLSVVCILYVYNCRIRSYRRVSSSWTNERRTIMVRPKHRVL